MRGDAHVRFGGRARETDRLETAARRPGPISRGGPCPLCGRKDAGAGARPDRSHLPLRPGVPARQTHDYVRNGTTNLYAALNLATGMVTHQLTARHRARRVQKVPRHHRAHRPFGA